MSEREVAGPGARDVPGWDFAWASRRARGADGNRIHYVAAGRSGPCVVLLHGWPGFWFDWRHVIGPLAARTRVIAPDLRGFGDSPPPQGAPSVVSGEANLARDVVAVLDDVGIDDAVFVGFDLGAAVAQALSRSWPARVRALVLSNPTHPGLGARRDLLTLRGEFWYQQLHLLPWAADLVAHDRRTLEVYLRHFYDHWCATPGALRGDEFAHVLDVYATPGAFEQSIAWYRARPKDRQAQATTDPAALVIAQPTTVLWSDSDPVAPPEWADGVEAWFTDASVVPVRGCGHFLPWERPAPLVRAVLEAAAR